LVLGVSAPVLFPLAVDWKHECAAVIPCLNEAEAIGPLVRAVRQHLPTVVVVDDGSTDETRAAAAQGGATVLRHDRPCGKGAALRTGWQHTRTHGFGWALTLDGDGQHAPSDIPAFLSNAEQTSAALVVGNRMSEAARMPWVRRVVNRWMSARLSHLAGLTLPDSQCGFRLHNLKVLARLPITATHFEIESEVLLAFVRANARVDFVPVAVIYKHERSKIHPLRDTVRWLRWWQGVKRETCNVKRELGKWVGP
jgi:glycosyltransferase involved in cell wall biosynthesis